MAELVDALDSKSGELYAHEGSIPSWGTKRNADFYSAFFLRKKRAGFRELITTKNTLC